MPAPAARGRQAELGGHFNEPLGEVFDGNACPARDHGDSSLNGCFLVAGGGRLPA